MTNFIAKPPFPNVPPLPGVPAIPRSVAFPPSPAPTLGTGAPAGVLFHATQSAPIWGVFDDANAQVIKPDSIVNFDNRNEFKVSNFPVEKGGFASYNKVVVPFEIALRMTKGGTLDDRTTFLAQVAAVAASLTLYQIVTPEQSYKNCNVTRYEVARHGPKGAYFLTEVDLFFIQIIQVTAQYSSVAAVTQNAKSPQAVPSANNGTTNAQPVSQSVIQSVIGLPSPLGG